MNFDLALVSAVLETQDMAGALREGAKPEHLGDEAAIYWDLLLSHYETFGQVPSLAYFVSVMPSYTHNPVQDGIPAIVAELKTRYLHNQIEKLLRDVVEVNSERPWDAKKMLVDRIDAINLANQRGNTDLVAGSNKSEVLDTLDYLQRGTGLLGYAWPWDYLNDNSIGLCRGHFAYFYGREKSKKTFVLIHLALFWESLGYRVLFCTREMPREEIAWRIYAMRGGFPYGPMMKGNVSADGRVLLEDVLDDLKQHRNLIITEVGDGITGLRAKIEEVKPHIVIHDYLKALADDEMEGKRNPQEHVAVARVADRVKKLAMDLKIAFVGCGHANREGEAYKGRSSIEYAHSDHIVRKLDYGFRVISDEHHERVAILLNAGRSTRKFLGWTISGTLCNGFGALIDTDISWVDGVDAVEKAEAQTKEEEPALPKGGPPQFKPKFRR